MPAIHSECNRCSALVSPIVEKVLAGDSCKECGRYSFKAGLPSYLYLLTHPTLKLHQIGIGTVGKDKDRLAKLLIDGWIAFGIWHGDRRTTFLWEKKIFTAIKKILTPRQNDGVAPFGKWVVTWSESISAEAISASEIEKIIAKVIKG